MFITLYGNGVMPMYRVQAKDLTQPIEQFFKIEFTDKHTSDVKLIRF